jgi:hypothetical protein
VAPLSRGYRPGSTVEHHWGGQDAEVTQSASRA